jgi:hypothetical protein
MTKFTVFIGVSSSRARYRAFGMSSSTDIKSPLAEYAGCSVLFSWTLNKAPIGEAVPHPTRGTRRRERRPVPPNIVELILFGSG